MNLRHGNPHPAQPRIDSRHCHHPRDDRGHGHQAPDDSPGALDAQGTHDLRTSHADHYCGDQDAVQDSTDSGTTMMDPHEQHDHRWR